MLVSGITGLPVAIGTGWYRYEHLIIVCSWEVLSELSVCSMFNSWA